MHSNVVNIYMLLREIIIYTQFIMKEQLIFTNKNHKPGKNMRKRSQGRFHRVISVSGIENFVKLGIVQNPKCFQCSKLL